MNYVESFNLFGVDAKQVPCIKGNGAPTTATEGVTGLFYMDIASVDGDLYKCMGVKDGEYLWAGFGSGGGSASIDDDNISAESTWSSQKLSTEFDLITTTVDNQIPMWVNIYCSREPAGDGEVHTDTSFDEIINRITVDQMDVVGYITFDSNDYGAFTATTQTVKIGDGNEYILFDFGSYGSIELLPGDHATYLPDNTARMDDDHVSDGMTWSSQKISDYINEVFLGGEW